MATPLRPGLSAEQPIQLLEGEKKEAVAKEQYRRAAQIQDEIQALRQPALPGGGRIFALSRTNSVAQRFKEEAARAEREREWDQRSPRKLAMDAWG